MTYDSQEAQLFKVRNCEKTNSYVALAIALTQTSLITAQPLPMIIADPIDRTFCRGDQLLFKVQNQDSYYVSTLNGELRNAETEATALKRVPM
eukprot:4803087-Prymnesium_polylepis.1